MRGEGDRSKVEEKRRILSIDALRRLVMGLSAVMCFAGAFAAFAAQVQMVDASTDEAREHIRKTREKRVPEEPALFFAGDSTLTWRKADSQYGSWGDELHPYLRKNIIVHNHAISGRSTRSFIEKGAWTNLVANLRRGDYVMVQFGHNDQSTRKDKCTTLDQYADNLRRMAADVRGAGAIPVFVTPIAQRVFGEDGKLRPDMRLGSYAERLSAVARELGIECVEMRAFTRAAIDEAGRDASLGWYLAGVQPPEEKHRDNVHPSKAGAKVFAGLFVKDVRENHKALAAALFAPPGGEKPSEVPVNLKRPVRLTQEAEAFFNRLRDEPKKGRFFFSWLNPWCGDAHAYTPRYTNCWRRTASGDYEAFPPKEAKLGPNTISGRAPGHEPLVYFLDFNSVAGTYYGREFYERNRAGLEAVVRKAYAEWGAIPVFSWHAENPYTPNRPSLPKYGTGSMFRYRYTSGGYPQEHRFVIREILDGTGAECGGGRNINMWRFVKPDDPIESWPTPRAWFEARLDEIASFIGRLKDGRGRPIPLVVRLWHECEDNWQWWGCGSATRDDYVKFFRLTVDGIRSRTGGGAQLLFMYSPDRHWISLGDADSKDDFMYRYPGDEYVDIIGYDDYSIAKGPMNRKGEHMMDCPNLREYIDARLAITISKMRLISAEAERRRKACGLIETGFRQATDDAFDVLMRAMTAEGVRFGLINIWGGYNVPPTPQGIDCFRRFLADPRVLTYRSAALQ